MSAPAPSPRCIRLCLTVNETYFPTKGYSEPRYNWFHTGDARDGLCYIITDKFVPKVMAWTLLHYGSRKKFVMGSGLIDELFQSVQAMFKESMGANFKLLCNA